MVSSTPLSTLSSTQRLLYPEVFPLSRSRCAIVQLLLQHVRAMLREYM